MIPPFESFLFPFLNALNDGTICAYGDVSSIVAGFLKLTDDDLAERIPSGYTTRFADRVKWARTFLLKAGLIESPGRGRVIITEKGIQALQDKPDGITVEFLNQYPEFRKFHTHAPKNDESETGTLDESSPDDESSNPVEITPEESIEHAFQDIITDRCDDLLNRIKLATPAFFENIVVELIVAMGYGGSTEEVRHSVTGGSHDGGIDGIINQDTLGLDVVCIQAKRWEGTVGRPQVQNFSGSLAGVHAKKGIMMTTSKFSKEAEEYVKNIENRIVLVDGEKIAKLMLEHGIGVTPVRTYVIKKIDNDYFDELT